MTFPGIGWYVEVASEAILVLSTWWYIYYHLDKRKLLEGKRISQMVEWSTSVAGLWGGWDAAQRYSQTFSRPHWIELLSGPDRLAKSWRGHIRRLGPITTEHKEEESLQTCQHWWSQSCNCLFSDKSSCASQRGTASATNRWQNITSLSKWLWKSNFGS